MRIIVERDRESRWSARWHDEPELACESGSALGAVAKLLLRSKDRHVASSDLIPDPSAQQPGYMEMVVLER